MEWSMHQCDRCGKKEQIPQADRDKEVKPDGWAWLDSLEGEPDVCGVCAGDVVEFIKGNGECTRSLQKLVDSDRKELMTRCKENSQLAGMLADISERMFGDNSRGAPPILAYQHASWVCGPGTKTKATFLEEATGKGNPEWEAFLLTLPCIAKVP